MCGIVGIINCKAEKNKANNDFKLNAVFEDMLWADQLRGLDNTGAMFLKNDLTLATLKTAGGFSSILKESKWSSLANWVDSHFFSIGHNRSATRGTKTAENAHPFQFENITLVHNGTLTWYPEKYKHKEYALDVDSRALTEMIHVLGIEEAVKNFVGAFAIVWIDKTDLSLNFAKNNERPLGLITLEDGYKLLSSESYLAAWCAQRHGFSVKQIEEIKDLVHYKVRYDDLENIKETILKPEIPPESLSTKSYYMGYPKYSGTGFGYNWDKDDDKKTVEFEAENNKKGKTKFTIVQNAWDDLKVGDNVTFKIDTTKEKPNQNFVQVIGTLENIKYEKTRHKIEGHIFYFQDQIDDPRVLWTGEIASILKSKTGFYLISVRSIQPVDREVPKTKTYFPAVAGDLDDQRMQTKCQGCDAFFPSKEVKELSRTIYNDGVTTQRVISVCPSCRIEVIKDFNTIFNEIYDRNYKQPQLPHLMKDIL